METQDAAEREKSKKSRKYPTPPAGSEASGLGITEEVVDFLLKHDFSNFTALDWSKLLER